MKKKLLVSFKSSTEVLNDFRKVLKKSMSKNRKNLPHFEISFDSKKDFDRFIRNVDILSDIIAFKPKSVYELSKICKIDVSNLNKLIQFFEEVGVVRIKRSKKNGREIKTPVVDYDTIEFRLAA